MSPGQRDRGPTSLSPAIEWSSSCQSPGQEGRDDPLIQSCIGGSRSVLAPAQPVFPQIFNKQGQGISAELLV